MNQLTKYAREHKSNEKKNQQQLQQESEQKYHKNKYQIEWNYFNILLHIRFELFVQCKAIVIN